jgi:hypothetical protein
VPGVGGSNPLAPTNFFLDFNGIFSLWGCEQGVNGSPFFFLPSLLPGLQSDT